jgi:hypothetical protein
MSFTGWVMSCFSRRGKTLSLFQSGIAKANNHDHDGAIADYSAVIRLPHIATEVKAMALYNRALSYSAIHEEAKSNEDLAAVLEMPGLPANVRTHAQQRRERIKQRNKKGANPAVCKNVFRR